MVITDTAIAMLVVLFVAGMVIRGQLNWISKVRSSTEREEK